MAPKKLVAALRLLVFALLLQLGTISAGAGAGKTRICKFPAIFNFGDSNSDTGAINAALAPVLPPNGEDFFGHPSGRICDGRLIIDFIAEKLELPYLSPYLDSLGTSFRHGANFATVGSSIRPGGFSPFDFGIQISQFIRFKSYISSLYTQHNNSTMKYDQHFGYILGKRTALKRKFPSAEDFSEALYTIDIGQNDLSYGFQHTTVEQLHASIPDIINHYSLGISQLYSEGARVFWVHNAGPIGCLPYNVIFYNSNPSNLDQNGCVKIQNAMAQEFNRQLKNRVLQLKSQLPLAAFTYVDVYSAKYALVSHAKAHGFVDPFELCCGGNINGFRIDCGKKMILKGKVFGKTCNNPRQHINWDGIHYTQAANNWVANHILNASFSFTPLSIGEACQRPKTG